MTRRSPVRALAAALLLAGAGPLHAQQPTGATKRADGTTLPLAMPDTLSFTVREGTWISLDVTPDGQRIVFELLGDLYALPIAGGAATPITDGPGFDSQPNVSPDGRWVAFISDRDGADNLWIARLDGTEPRKLSSERQNQILSPEWTPDNQYVLATVHGRETQIRMYHVDGGTGIDLKGPGTGPANRADGAGAAMSPDGRWLYFTRRVGSPNANFPGWEVARRDMTSGVVDVLTQAEWGAVRPVLSPDGKQLVYATRHETETGLRIRNLETGADRWLIWPVQPDEQEGGGRAPSRDFLPGYAFTPDGREVITTFDGKIQAVDVATGRARVIPFQASVKLAVGPELETPYRVEQGPVRAKLVQSPRFSPDGRQMVFSVLTKLYRMDVPGGTPRRLTGGEQWEFMPAWSPDGQWIAFVTWTTDGGHVWKIRSDGRGEPQRLTSAPAFYTDVTFSSDGTRIVGLRGNAFLRNRTFSEFGGLRIPLDVVWLPANGGEVRVISPANGVGQPHFAAEADRVLIHTREGLVSMRYDGTDRRPLLKVTGRPNPRSPEPPQADEILARPDGRWALASSANQLYLVAIPPAGGEAPTVSVGGGGVPVKKITDIGADYFGWADGGRNIYWAIGSTVYRLPFDSVTIRPDERPSAPPAVRTDSAVSDSTRGDSIPTPAPAADTTKKPLDFHRAAQRIDVAIDFPRPRPTGSVVLRGATAITMRGTEVIPNADIVVTENRIAAVGARGTVPIPAGAREIDASGKFVVPGFIDTHAHWEFRTHDVLEPHNWSLIANLAYGVTAGLDVQTSTNDYFAYQDLVETGQTVGQRAFMVGPGVFSTNDFRSYEEVEAFLRRYKEHYRTPNIKSYMVGNRQQRQWVVQAAKKLGLMPTTEGGRDMKLDLTHAIDGFHGNEHTLPIVPLFEDVVQLYARTRTAYTPTLLVLYGGPGAVDYFFTRENPHEDPKLNRFYPQNWLGELTRRRGEWTRDDEQRFDEVAAQAAKIQRAGGLIGVGGHGELQGLGYHWEMWSFAMGGMTPYEVLRAATIDGARIIGIQQDLGSLEAGKLADLVVLERNPLANIRNTNSAHLVMKNGELYEADTMTQIWPARKELPRFWWWGSEPADRRGGR